MGGHLTFVSDSELLSVYHFDSYPLQPSTRPNNSNDKYLTSRHNLLFTGYGKCNACSRIVVVVIVNIGNMIIFIISVIIIIFIFVAASISTIIILDYDSCYHGNGQCNWNLVVDSWMLQTRFMKCDSWNWDPIIVMLSVCPLLYITIYGLFVRIKL